jgi:glycosyltransferase involved in cell wall biosynthesis
MQNGKYIVARLFSKDEGTIPSRMPVFLGINPEKYEVIFVYNAKDLKKPNIFEQKGKKVFYVSSKKDAPSFSTTIIWKLSRLLKAEKVDIVHCHQHKATVHGVIAAKLAGVPVIFTHIHGTGRTRNISRRLMNRIIFRWANRILTVGQAVREDVILTNPGVDPEKVISVGNSIDYDKFSQITKSESVRVEKFGIRKDVLVFGTAGRLAETKGYKFLLEAFAHVKKQIPNCLLLFAGTGELRNLLEKQACKLGCGDSVRFLGYVNNISEFYSTLDIFVLPSVAEGLPRGLMEAMAAGVICIASNVGGIPEIIEDGKNGFLAAAKDSKDLARVMIEAAKLPLNEKAEIVKAGRKNIYDNFRHSVVIEREEKIYDAEIEKISLLSVPK